MSPVLWVGLSAVGARALGFFREVFLAAGFGTGNHTDAFMLATTLPTLLIPAVAMGASTVLVTHYRNDARGRMVATQAVVVMGAVFLLVATATWLSPGVVVSLLGAPHGRNTDTLSVLAVRYLSPAALFYGLNVILAGVMQAYAKFRIASLAVLAGSVVTVVLFGVSATTHDFPLLLGAIDAGQAVQFIVLLSGAWGVFSWVASGGKTRAVWSTVVRQVPVMIAGLTTFQVAAAIDRSLASQAPAGTLSALRFGDLLGSLPLNIVSYAVIYVIYPKLIAFTSQEERLAFSKAGTWLLSFLFLPLCALLFILRAPIVRMVFERGAFTSSSANLTFDVLAGFSVGLVFLAVWDWVSRERLLAGDSGSLLFLGVGVWIANFLLGRLLLSFGGGGIALATSLAFALGTAGLLGRQAISLRTVAAAAPHRLLPILIALAGASAIWEVTTYVHDEFLLVVGALIGLVVYWFLAILLRVPEVALVLNLVRKAESTSSQPAAH